MPDQDFFDEVFRRASDEPDIPFNETAWTRMEQKLAREERRRFFWLWLRRGLLAVFLLSSLLFGWNHIQKNKYTNTDETNTTQIPAGKHKIEKQAPGQDETAPLPPDQASNPPVGDLKTPESIEVSKPKNADHTPSTPKNTASDKATEGASVRQDRLNVPNLKTTEPKTSPRPQNKGGRKDAPARTRPPQVAVPPPQDGSRGCSEPPEPALPLGYRR
jgi:cytoskeletal protein RodZ